MMPLAIIGLVCGLISIYATWGAVRVVFPETELRHAAQPAVFRHGRD